MTKEEAAEGIRKFRNSISRNAENFRSPDPWVQTISMYSVKILYGYEFIEELNMAIAALEKRDKYRWHDLRKDPNDLPTKNGLYAIAYMDGVDIGFGQYEIFYGYGGGWSAKSGYGEVIAWKEIEPFEEER